MPPPLVTAAPAANAELSGIVRHRISTAIVRRFLHSITHLFLLFQNSNIMMKVDSDYMTVVI